MMNRRQLIAMLAAASASLKTRSSLAEAVSLPAFDPGALPDSSVRPDSGAKAGFPPSDYTPFGYLDNPWHTWDMHRSGVFRSLPGIGFGLYFPAGPGGYFDYKKNGIYAAELALGFRIGEHSLMAPEDFRPGQLTSPNHSTKVFSYAFEQDGVRITSVFFQVDEDALAVRLEILEEAGRRIPVQVLASHTHRLGGSQWWGGDGLAGDFDAAADALWTRSFAAGTVFAVGANRQSDRTFFSARDEDRKSWLGLDAKTAGKLSYDRNPLHGGLRYNLVLDPHSRSEFVIAMSRGTNLKSALKHGRASLVAAPGALDRKRAEDDSFWSAAPKLAGDWPKHWQHGWVYDFETLRTMVRRPIGVYKHPWDAMQIQAPRNVLAETSIDMWALSYAQPELAKSVFLGQFLDALEDNIPCMREDGVMNMVAADGSECGTSISWCFPFFCAASIYDRTQDLEWLRQLYPRLCALLRWTLAHRTDSAGFVVGKCSWETGMDASKRFGIEQPTGGELVDFLRLVELQAAASHAGATLARFAKIVSDRGNIEKWQDVQQDYAAKTQQLWKDDWFHDFDMRTMKLVEITERDPSQAAPAFCGIATGRQKKDILRTLQKMYADMEAQTRQDLLWADFPLGWSSFVLPYLESAWSAGDGELASRTVESICNRIYTSMDRHSIEDKLGSAGSRPRLGWPGVSCEVWGAHGAFGGEVYGWGAVMPAHIIRNLIGFRETEIAYRVVFAPGFGAILSGPGKKYGIAGLTYANQRFNLHFTFIDDRRMDAEFVSIGLLHVVTVVDADGRPVPVKRTGSSARFQVENFARYVVALASRPGR